MGAPWNLKITPPCSCGGVAGKPPLLVRKNANSRLEICVVGGCRGLPAQSAAAHLSLYRLTLSPSIANGGQFNHRVTGTALHVAIVLMWPCPQKICGSALILHRIEGSGTAATQFFCVVDWSVAAKLGLLEKAAASCDDSAVAAQSGSPKHI